MFCIERKPKKYSKGQRAVQEIRNLAQSTKKMGKGKWGKILFTLFLIGVLTLTMFMSIFLIYVNTTLAPDLTVNVDEYTMNLTTKVYCRDSETDEWIEYENIHGVEDRTLVSYDAIPQYLKDAVVAIEDQRFWQHNGVDWKRTGGAVVNMFFGMRNTFGGSTITQQLIKNITQDNEGTVKRKVTEIFRALEFEKNYTKEEILHLYLNTVYFGKDAYGVGAAAQTYFGKEVSELSLAESACIVGITNNPYRYNPLRSDWTQEQNKNRQELILEAMWKQKFISKEEYQTAMAETLQFSDGKGNYTTSVQEPTKQYYSYFTDYVIKQVLNDLQTQNGMTEKAATAKLFNGGCSIYITMNPKIQQIAEGVFEDRAKNLNYTSAKGQPLQAGITIIDPYTGNVVAMVGGIGEKVGDRIGSYATAIRPCGSAIKPLSIYAPCLDAGVITTASVVDDYPVEILNDKVWPKNSHGGYTGLTTVETAVAESMNTVAVRLLTKLTPSASYAFLTERLGFTSLVKEDLQASALSLGGFTKGVSTLEMAAAYSSFVNQGVYTEPRVYTKVLDNGGNVILENQTESHTAMKESTAYQMNQLLQKVVTSGTGTSASFSGMTIAGKTGTTSNNYDRYFVGYTPYYCGAVWIGYEYMEKISVSGNPAAVLWRKVMSQVHEELPDKDFFTPTSGQIKTVTVCSQSGLLVGDACTKTHTVTVAANLTPTETCAVHQTITVCTDSNCLADEHCTHTETRSVVDYPHRQTLYEPNDAEGVAVLSKDAQEILQYWEQEGICDAHEGTETPILVEPQEPQEPALPPVEEEVPVGEEPLSEETIEE